MANHASSKKRIRQIARRTDVNMARRNRARTYVRRVEKAIAAGNKDEAVAAFRAAQPELHRCANRGVFHKNMVARKLSRLSARIKTLEA